MQLKPNQYLMNHLLRISFLISLLLIAMFVVDMEQGRIVEQGTHQQLLEAQGAYAAMFKLSQSGVLS